MASTLPFKTAIGFGQELARGTAVARTNWLEVESCELAEVANYERFPVLGAANGGGGRLVSHIASKLLSGRIVLPLQYEGLGWWLEQLMGGIGTTGGGAPYSHTYTLGPLPPRYLTVEKVIGTSGRRELYTGICVTGGRLRINRSSVAMLELDVVGYSSSGFDTEPSPSFGAAVATRAVYGRHFDNSASGIPMEITWNGGNHTVQDLEIRWANNVSDVGDLGSYYATAMDQGGEAIITVAAGLRHIGTATEALRTAHLAQTSSDLTFSCTGDAANQVIDFTCRNAEIQELPPTPLSGSSRVVVRPVWTCHHDSSDGALDIVVQNTQATHSTN
jgi:hypothetical protein